MIAALILNCRAQRVNFFATIRRISGFQATASSSNSGSRVTLFLTFIILLLMVFPGTVSAGVGQTLSIGCDKVEKSCMNCSAENRVLLAFSESFSTRATVARVDPFCLSTHYDRPIVKH